MPTLIKRQGVEIDLDACEPYLGDDHITIVNEVRLPDKGGIVTHSFRTPAEIRQDLDEALDYSVCECGHEFKPNDYDDPCPKCGGDCMKRTPIIDEYSSSCHSEDEDQPIAPRDWFRYSISVWCEPGANEGHSVYVTVLFFRDHEPIIAKNIYRIKTWRGLDGAHDTVWRIMKLLDIR